MQVTNQHEKQDIEAKASGNADGSYSRRRRRLLTVLGLMGLAGLATRILPFGTVEALTTLRPDSGTLRSLDSGTGASEVYANESRFVSIRNEGSAPGVSGEINNAYRAIQEQTGVMNHIEVDSLEAGWDYRIEITDFDVVVPSLPRYLDGLRIAHLADLHVGQFVGVDDVRQIAGFVASLRPDVVVITGDHVFHQDSQDGLESALGHLASLPATLGIYATMGNHDHWDGIDTVRDALSNVGITMLDNENREISAGLWLAGIDDLLAGRPDLEATLAGIPSHAATVLLSHNPLVIPQTADRPLLVLSGHTHGGQVRFAGQDFSSTERPDLYAHLMTAFETVGYVKRQGNLEGIGAWRYMEGWYQPDVARAYVSRGLGVVRPPFRVNCPAELTLLRLRATAQGTSN